MVMRRRVGKEKGLGGRIDGVEEEDDSETGFIIINYLLVSIIFIIHIYINT